ncbi:zinc finger MYM-type protein 1 [Trichonephila clavipes]|nr:zinc finger MYM-type protein 1 [Trichonephila clavipes]
MFSIRGTEAVFGSAHNDNFMGVLELQAEFNPLVQFLEKNGLLLDNCRGQSFDNAANMSDRYNGMQAHLKEKNKFAKATNIFFSASTHRRELLNREIKLRFTLKGLSQTRWSCHYDAVEALKR